MMPIASLVEAPERYLGEESNQQDREVIKTEKNVNQGIERVLDELGSEIALEVLGRAEELPDIKEPAILTVTCASGHIIIPNTRTILVNPVSDPLQIHNFLNRPWGEFLTVEREKDTLVPCAVRLSIDESKDFRDVHGQFGSLSGHVTLEEEQDRVGGLRVKRFKPDSKLNPLSVEGLTQKSVFGDEDGKGKTLGDEEIFKKAKALVMAKLAAGAADNSDTRQPIDSFDHVDSAGQKSRVHVEYQGIKAVLVDDKGEKVELSTVDVASLYSKFYSGGPESGETFSGVEALVPDNSTERRDKIDVDAKVISTDVLNMYAQELLKVGDPNKPLAEALLLNGEFHPIKALNRFLLEELEENPVIADKVKFRPIIHIDTTGTDKHNFVFMETMLYDHLRKPDFEHHNVGDRKGRNLTPMLLSPGIMVFRDDFMAGKIPRMGDNYIVMVKGAGSWKVGRFTDSQEIDNWLSE